MYPPLIHLDDKTQEELREFINTQLINHYMEKNQWINDLNNYQKDYWAASSEEDVEYPFKGASNLIIPLTAISVEAIHARNLTTMFALEQFIATKAISDNFEDTAEPLQNFLNKELLQQVHFRKHFENTILEIEKYGTGISKTGYERIVKKAMKLKGKKWEEFEFVQKDGPTVDSPSIGRFLMRFHETDPQTALWCGEEHTKTPKEVQDLENSEFFYEGVSAKLLNYLTFTQQGDQFVDRKVLTVQEELEDRQPTLPELYDIHEIWISWNADRNELGTKRELVLWYHWLSRTFLAIRYNWYDDLRRPYRYGNYIPVENRWTGIGICKQNQDFQLEITTQHRQRLDNASLANMRMFKIKKLSGYGPDEPVFPGKMWFLDDMEDIETIQLGEVYQSSFANEQATLIYSQQRTGVNEVTLGQPQVGTPGTATAELTRVQEGNRKFDYTYSNIKALADRVVLDTVLNIHQFGPHNVEYYDYNQHGQLVAEFFRQPYELVAKQILIEITTAGQKNNKLLDRTNWQTIAQLYNQWITGMLQLAMPLQNPQLIQLLSMKGITGGTEAFKQILESYDIRNIERIIPINELKQLIAGIADVQNQTGPGGQATASIQSGPVSSAAGGNGFTTLIPQSRIANIIRTTGADT